MSTYVTSSSKSVSNAQATSGGCGCLGCIGTIIVLWALFLGVTYGGKHYELSCSCDQGGVPASSSAMKKLNSLPEDQQRLFEIDEHFDLFWSNKKLCTNTDLNKYYQIHGDFPHGKLYVVAEFIMERLSQEYPDIFTLSESCFTSKLTGARIWPKRMTPKFLFHAVAMQVPEDLIIFSDKTEVVHLMSPAGWSAEWAVGKSFSALHDHVLDSSGKHVVRDPNKMAAGLRKMKESTVRVGAVAFYSSLVLNRHPDISVRDDWSFGPHQRAFVRFERQTVTPFKHDGLFLFTIRPYYNDLLDPKRIDDAIEAIKNSDKDAYWRTFLAEHGDSLLEFLEYKKANPADNR